MRASLLCVALGAAACVTSGETLDASTSDGGELGATCATGRPETLDDCARVGLTFADCGGTAASPSFACSAVGCRWFAGGCVPSGWKVSACDASMLCCVAGGPWELPPSSAEMAVYETTYAWGTLPWDEARELNVTGAIAAVPATNAFDCTGFPATTELTPCTQMHAVAPYFGGRGLVTIWVPPTPPPAGYQGWDLAVEAVRDSVGTIRARACRTGFTDMFRPDKCADVGAPPICASSGTLTLDAWPGTRASMHLVFPDGTAIDATL